MDNVERRSAARSVVVPSTPATRGRARQDTSPKIHGVAAVFNQETIVGGAFREKIHPHAFDQTLSRDDDVRALFNHDPNQLLGRTTSGTLRLKATDAGLQYDVDLPDTTPGRDIHALITRGDVSRSSFGFIVDRDEWLPSPDRDGLPLRVVRTATLIDVSPVSFPAYPQTSVSARARATALIGTSPTDDVKRLLRKARLADTKACLAAARRSQPSKIRRSSRAVIGTLVGVATPLDTPVFHGSECYEGWCFRESIRAGGQTLTLDHRSKIPATFRELSEFFPQLHERRAGALAELRFRVDIHDSAVGRQILADVRSGAIRYCSIGFTSPAPGDVGGGRTARIKKAHLAEISLVKNKVPANHSTHVRLVTEGAMGRLAAAVADLTLARRSVWRAGW